MKKSILVFPILTLIQISIQASHDFKSPVPDKSAQIKSHEIAFPLVQEAKASEAVQNMMDALDQAGQISDLEQLELTQFYEKYCRPEDVKELCDLVLKRYEKWLRKIAKVGLDSLMCDKHIYPGFENIAQLFHEPITKLIAENYVQQEADFKWIDDLHGIAGLLPQKKECDYIKALIDLKISKKLAEIGEGTKRLCAQHEYAEMLKKEFEAFEKNGPKHDAQLIELESHIQQLVVLNEFRRNRGSISTAIALSKDQQFLVYSIDDTTLTFFDRSSKKRKNLNRFGSIKKIKFSDNGRYLFIGEQGVHLNHSIVDLSKIDILKTLNLSQLITIKQIAQQNADELEECLPLYFNVLKKFTKNSELKQRLKKSLLFTWLVSELKLPRVMAHLIIGYVMTIPGINNSKKLQVNKASWSEFLAPKSTCIIT